MKQKVVHLRAVFFSGNSNNGANAGVRNANTNNSAANANANNGSHLGLLGKNNGLMETLPQKQCKLNELFEK